jgi:hypothetical protein
MGNHESTRFFSGHFPESFTGRSTRDMLATWGKERKYYYGNLMSLYLPKSAAESPCASDMGMKAAFLLGEREGHPLNLEQMLLT